MIITEILGGACLIEIQQLEDERGFFARTFCNGEFAQAGLEAVVAQCSISYSHQKGTMRGMHFQIAPHQETKLVRCTRGSIFDSIVDIRPDSPTYKQWFAVELTADNRKALFVPKGYAHGFLTLADNTEVFYQISTPFAPAFARGFVWNDPVIGIAWPFAPIVISDRDAAYPVLDAIGER